jgi:hypothetical protein
MMPPGATEGSSPNTGIYHSNLFSRFLLILIILSPEPDYGKPAPLLTACHAPEMVDGWFVVAWCWMNGGQKKAARPDSDRDQPLPVAGDEVRALRVLRCTRASARNHRTTLREVANNRTGIPLHGADAVPREAAAH